jgi:hypothetical protein
MIRIKPIDTLARLIRALFHITTEDDALAAASARHDAENDDFGEQCAIDHQIANLVPTEATR